MEDVNMDVDKLKSKLLSQKASAFKGNVYHWTQVCFAYHSNKIEGSQLSEEQAEMIYATHSFLTKREESVKLDDLIEMSNHFKMFDYMVDNVDKPLSKEIVIKMNVILKRGTSDEDNPRYNVGGFNNGIVGRMIMFKECLKHGIVPFVVLDQDKTFYLRGLREYSRQQNYLIDTCLHEQDLYEDVCRQLLNFDIEESSQILE